jgi:hypothetical protein
MGRDPRHTRGSAEAAQASVEEILDPMKDNAMAGAEEMMQSPDLTSGT